MAEPVREAAPAPVETEDMTVPEEPELQTEPAEEASEEPAEEPSASEGPDLPPETEVTTSETAETPAAEEMTAEEPEISEEEPAAQREEEPETEQPAEGNDGQLSDQDLLEVEMIVSCIGPENLAEIHNQLAILFGERGKEIYQGLKSGEITVNPQKGETVEKYHVYGQLIFSRAGEAFPEDLPQFLLDSRDKMKNLNSLRYALQKRYGKDKGHRYYYVLKPFVKVLNQM